jgi:hypothetical protein
VFLAEPKIHRFEAGLPVNADCFCDPARRVSSPLLSSGLAIMIDVAGHSAATTLLSFLDWRGAAVIN